MDSNIIEGYEDADVVGAPIDKSEEHYANNDDENDYESETFVAGYEADGSLIEGFENKKKLRRKLRRARRRARHAENQLANSRNNSYWDGWWDSSRDNNYYNPPIVYSQPPVYVTPSQPDSSGNGDSGSSGGGADWPWVVFAGLVFIVFVILMVMIAMRQ